MTRQLRCTEVGVDAQVKDKNYRPSDREPFMNERQREYFRNKLLAWKESGGFGGTFSPNAAFGQTVFLMTAGHTYTFSLRWKTNHAASGAGATILAGAGPISGIFSPTSLDVELVA